MPSLEALFRRAPASGRRPRRGWRARRRRLLRRGARLGRDEAGHTVAESAVALALLTAVAAPLAATLTHVYLDRRASERAVALGLAEEAMEWTLAGLDARSKEAPPPWGEATGGAGRAWGASPAWRRARSGSTSKATRLTPDGRWLVVRTTGPAPEEASARGSGPGEAGRLRLITVAVYRARGSGQVAPSAREEAVSEAAASSRPLAVLHAIRTRPEPLR